MVGGIIHYYARCFLGFCFRANERHEVPVHNVSFRWLVVEGGKAGLRRLTPPPPIFNSGHLLKKLRDLFLCVLFRLGLEEKKYGAFWEEDYRKTPVKKLNWKCRIEAKRNASIRAGLRCISRVGRVRGNIVPDPF